MMLKWMVPQVLGVGLYIAGSRSSDTWAARIFPLYFIGVVVIFNVIFYQKGWSLEKAAEEGWLVQNVDAGTPDVLYRSMWSFENVHIKYVWGNFGDLVVAACLGPVLSIGVKTNMMQPILKERIDLNDELLVNGKSMLGISLLSGYPAYAALGNTKLHICAGGSTRWSTVLAGCVTGCFFSFPWMAQVVRVIPNALIGGLFVNYGLEFMGGAAKEYWRIKKVEYALVWCMVVVSIVSSFSHAIVYGLMGSFVIFIHQYSLVNNVLLESYLNILMSHSERTMKQEQSLQVAASSVFVLRLTGYLYFATIIEVSESIQRRIREHKEHSQGSSEVCLIRQIVLDFTAVPNMDTSAQLSICTLCEDLYGMGVHKVHFTGFNNDGRYKRLYRMLGESEYNLGDEYIDFHGDFDEALSELEDQLLESLIGSADRQLALLRDRRLKPLARCSVIMQVFGEWISANRGFCDDAGCLWQFILQGCCERQLITKGEVIAEVGDKGKGVWLLLQGTIVGTLSVDFQGGQGKDGIEHLWSNQEGQCTSAHAEIVQQWSGNGLLVGTTGIHSRNWYSVSHSAATDCEAFYISCEHIAQMRENGHHQAVAALTNIALTYSSRNTRWLQRSRLAMEAQTKGEVIDEELQFVDSRQSSSASRGSG